MSPALILIILFSLQNPAEYQMFDELPSLSNFLSFIPRLMIK